LLKYGCTHFYPFYKNSLSLDGGQASRLMGCSVVIEALLSKPEQFALLAVRINLFVLNKPGGLGVMVNLNRATIRKNVVSCPNLPPGFDHP
jgi:hypothetical protein